MSTHSVTAEYMIRRKILTLFGAKFHIYDPSGQLIGFSKQKAFRLKEDIRVFSDESMNQPLIAINARNVIDFSAAYDVTDSQKGVKMGALRRKGMASLIQDQWEVLDANDNLIGRIQEDSTALALLRRFAPMGNLVPQEFRVTRDGGESFANIRTHFNPFVQKMTVSVYENCPLHSYQILAAGILISAIEGRQN